MHSYLYAYLSSWSLTSILSVIPSVFFLLTQHQRLTRDTVYLYQTIFAKAGDLPRFNGYSSILAAHQYPTCLSFRTNPLSIFRLQYPSLHATPPSSSFRRSSARPHCLKCRHHLSRLGARPPRLQPCGYPGTIGRPLVSISPRYQRRQQLGPCGRPSPRKARSAQSIFSMTAMETEAQKVGFASSMFPFP